MRERGEYRAKHRNRETYVLPAPWRSQNPCTFDSLSDEHTLERILIGGLLASTDKTHRDWAEKAMKDLSVLRTQHGWKRAFKLWNAVIRPDSEAFVDAILQDEATRSACLKALRDSVAGQVLSELLAPAAP